MGINLIRRLRVRIRAARLFPVRMRGWREPYFFSHWNVADELPVEVLRIAFQEAKDYVKAQEDQYLHVVKVSSTLLGWIVAAIMSLVGAFAALAPGGWSVSMSMVMYGIVALSLPASVLVLGIHVGQHSYLPGNKPSVFLSAETWDSLTELEGKSRKEKWFLMGSLWQLEREAFLNDKWNMRRVRAYRLALSLLASGVMGALLLAILL